MVAICSVVKALLLSSKGMVITNPQCQYIQHLLRSDSITPYIVRRMLLLSSAARPIIATFGLRISASIYIWLAIYNFPQVCWSRFPRPQGAGIRVQNGAVTWMLCRLRTHSARRAREMGKSITQFHQGRLTTAPRLVEFVYSLCKSRSSYEC